MQFSGAFWATLQRFNMNSHAIDQVLSREDVTLEDVLNEDMVVQEMRNQNQKLLEFFTSEKLEKLIELVTVYPDLEAGQKRTQNHPFIACELLSESGQIHDNIAESPQLLEKLFSFLKTETLHPTLLGYFSKTVQALLSRAFDKTLSYLGSLGTQSLVNHIGQRSIVDIITKILQSDSLGKDEIFSIQKQVLCQVFDKLIHGGEWECMHSSLLLSDIINKVTDIPLGKELVQSIVEESNIKLLFDLLTSETQYKIIASAGVVKTLYLVNFRVDFVSLYPWFNLSEYFIEILGKLETTLATVPATKITNTIKEEIAPLGEARLKLIEVIAYALKNSKENVYEKVAEGKIPEVLIKLFFTYPWHSMLHSTIDLIIQNAQHSSHEKIIKSFFCSKTLIQEILSSVKQSSKHRLGHLGYVHKFANYLKETSDPLIKEFLSSEQDWTDFTLGYLKERNNTEKRQLGQFKQLESSSKSDLRADDKEEPGNEVNAESDGKVNETEGQFNKLIEEKIDEESKNESMPTPTSPIWIIKERRLSDELNRSPKSDHEYGDLYYWKLEIIVDEIEDLD